jgi:Condensation domain
MLPTPLQMNAHRVYCTVLQVWRVSASLHILLVSMHHSIIDGWSVTVLRSELAAAYAAACSGTEPSWQRLPVQVADYAAWQRSNLQLDEELAWWAEALAGAPPLLELPYDRSRPEVFSHKGAHVQHAMSNVTANALAELAAQHQTTPFVVALTALQVGGLTHLLCIAFGAHRHAVYARTAIIMCITEPRHCCNVCMM